jgi:RND family efflux transporter MFP subunit
MTDSAPDLSSLRISRDDPPQRSGGTGRRVLLVALLALVGLGAIAGFVLSRPRATEVKVATVSAEGGGTVSSAGITANGYVVARTKASVSAKISGQLEYLGVHEGSVVHKDEVIARIQSGDYQAALAAARAALGQYEAQLAQARRDLERATTLADQKVLAAADLENARTKVSVLEAQTGSARAQVQLADVNLENTRVRAPFDGTVLNKDAEVGEIVAPASAGGALTRTAIVTMADLATLEVEVDVNEAYISQVRNGQPAAITLDAYPDTSFRGRVRQVIPTADRQKATVLVKVSILDRDPRILPEMGAKVVFERESGAAAVAAPRRVLLPAAAVVRSGASASVWIVENGRVASRVIQLGRERDASVEVLSGLAGGESVVVDPPPALKDGARVRVVGS